MSFIKIAFILTIINAIHPELATSKSLVSLGFIDLFSPPKFLNCSMHVQVSGKSRRNNSINWALAISQNLNKFLLWDI